MHPVARGHPRRFINRALSPPVRARNLLLACSLALFHLVEGYSYRRLPRQPRRFTISAPHPVPSHYCDSLQPTSSPSNSSEQSLAPSIPIQPGATRSNVRSVTLLHTACLGSCDGFLAFLHLSFALQLLSLPVLSLFVSRALFRVARASIETVQCSTQTSLSPCLSSSLGKYAAFPYRDRD